eukprot:SAG22_NODE_1656_length_3888_cov_3.928477_3_plen_748_part_00
MRPAAGPGGGGPGPRFPTAFVPGGVPGSHVRGVSIRVLGGFGGERQHGPAARRHAVSCRLCSCVSSILLAIFGSLLVSSNLPACWFVDGKDYFEGLYAERAAKVAVWNRTVAAWQSDGRAACARSGVGLGYVISEPGADSVAVGSAVPQKAGGFVRQEAGSLVAPDLTAGERASTVRHRPLWFGQTSPVSAPYAWLSQNWARSSTRADGAVWLRFRLTRDCGHGRNASDGSTCGSRPQAYGPQQTILANYKDIGCWMVPGQQVQLRSRDVDGRPQHCDPNYYRLRALSFVIPPDLAGAGAGAGGSGEATLDGGGGGGGGGGGCGCEPLSAGPTGFNPGRLSQAIGAGTAQPSAVAASGLYLAGGEQDVVTFGGSPAQPLLFVPAEAKGPASAGSNGLLSLAVRCSNDPDVLAGPMTEYSFDFGLTPEKRRRCSQLEVACAGSCDMGVLLLLPLVCLLSFHCCARCQRPGGPCEQLGVGWQRARSRATQRCKAECIARLPCCGRCCCCREEPMGLGRQRRRPWGNGDDHAGGERRGAGGDIELVVGARVGERAAVEAEIEEAWRARQEEQRARRLLLNSIFASTIGADIGPRGFGRRGGGRDRELEAADAAAAAAAAAGPAVSVQTLDRLEAQAAAAVGGGLLLSEEPGDPHRRCSICLVELCIEEQEDGNDDGNDGAGGGWPTAAAAGCGRAGGGPPILLDCGHVFHRECGREWLVVRPSCPECRAPVVDDQKPSAGALNRGVVEQP